MSWTRSELIDWVRARIDELSPTQQTVVAGTNAIGQELDEAALQTIHIAPKQLLYPAAENYAGLSSLLRLRNSEVQAVVIPLQETFARFLRLRLYDWSAAVDELVSVDSATYKAQVNPYTRGTIDKPVAALVPFIWTYPGGTAPAFLSAYQNGFSLAIEAYPGPEDLSKKVLQTWPDGWAKESAYGLKLYANSYEFSGKEPVVAECMIVSEMKAEEMPSKLIDPLVWLAAGRVLSSLRAFDAGKVAYANAEAVLLKLKMGLAGEDMVVRETK